MLNMLVAYLRAWLGRNEEGQAMTEYALILALVAIVVIGAIVVFREQLMDLYGAITGGITNPGTTPGTGT